MATVNETVTRLIQTSPTIFNNRTDALHHILIVAGSGFRWDENGEAINTDPRPHWDKETWLEELMIPEGPIGDVMYEGLSEIADAAQVIYDNAAERALIHDSNWNTAKTYPYTPNCLAINMPENVTQDWALAVQEIVDFLAVQEIAATL